MGGENKNGTMSRALTRPVGLNAAAIVEGILPQSDLTRIFGNDALAAIDMAGLSRKLVPPVKGLGEIAALRGVEVSAGLRGVSEQFARIAELAQLAQPGAFQAESVSAIARMFGQVESESFTGKSWNALAGATRSRSEDFTNPSTEPSPYSKEMTGPSAYFKRHEVVIDSFDDLHSQITALTRRTEGLRLTWRGVVNAEWGLHSKLFRRLMELNGVKQPGPDAQGAQPFPDEDQMVRAEVSLLAEARSRWRFDGTPALEMLAKMQHFGAPTRLLDVSRNPYVASWFAVENQEGADHLDGRLFAIATTSVGADVKEQRYSEVFMDESGTSYMPFWHLLDTPEARQKHDWGTGSRRRVWFPPAYEQRIVAQNAGFVLDGVPITSAGSASHFRKTGGGGSYWKRSDLLVSASVYAKTYDPARTARPNKAKLAPVFTYRITAKAKKDIRRYLETYFDYSTATVYPDIAALSQHLDRNLAEIIAG